MQKILQLIQSFSFKQKTLGTLVILVFVAVAFTLLTPNSKPQPKPEMPQYKDKEYQLSQVYFDGQPITIPRSLSIYQALTPPPTLSELSNQITQKLNLNPIPNSTNAWQSPDSSALMFADPKNNKIILSIAPPQSTNQILTEDELTKKVVSYLNQVGFTQITPDNLFKIDYLTDDFEPKNTTVDKAEVVKLAFKSSLDKIPIYYESQTSTDLWVFANRFGEITKITASPVIVDVKKSSSLSTIAINQAVSNINSGNYTIINNYQTSGEPQLLTAFDQVRLNQVALEYRFLPKQNLLYPYYRFLGTAQKSSSAHTLEIITPAIPTQ